MRLLLLIIIVSIALLHPAPARAIESVSVSVGTNSLTVPWHAGPVADRLNPVFTVGTDRTWKSGTRTRLYYTANFGVFQHYWWMTGLYVNAELGGGYELPLGFHADARLGAGYLHYFWRRKTLKLEDGVYVPARDWGRPSLMAPFSIVLGYRRSHERPLRIAPFVSAQWAVQGLFTDEISVMTHLFLFVGVRIDLGRTTTAGGR